MRRSPPKIGQTATKAAKKGRKSLEMTPQPPQTALKRQHRRSRRRCSDVPCNDLFFSHFTSCKCAHMRYRLIHILRVQLVSMFVGDHNMNK